jgi:hypothetical protein
VVGEVVGFSESGIDGSHVRVERGSDTHDFCVEFQLFVRNWWGLIFVNGGSCIRRCFFLVDMLADAIEEFRDGAGASKGFKVGLSGSVGSFKKLFGFEY